MSNNILIKYDDFSHSSIHLNYDAAILDGKLLLTPSWENKSASAYYNGQINLSDNGSFSTYFVFKIQRNEPSRGDGFTFIVQANDISSIGEYGSNLGYNNIKNSLAIEFDTFLNPTIFDFTNNHVAIDTGGSVIHLNYLDVVDLDAEKYDLAPIPSIPYYVWVDYNGSTHTLEIRFNNSKDRPLSPILAKNIDLIGILGKENVYVGFTAGTGSQYEEHQILSWYFDNKYNPINIQTRGIKFENIP